MTGQVKFVLDGQLMSIIIFHGKNTNSRISKNGQSVNASGKSFVSKVNSLLLFGLNNVNAQYIKALHQLNLITDHGFEQRSRHDTAKPAKVFSSWLCVA